MILFSKKQQLSEEEVEDTVDRVWVIKSSPQVFTRECCSSSTSSENRAVMGNAGPDLPNPNTEMVQERTGRHEGSD